MKFKLITCEIFYREFSAALARSPHQVNAEFLPKGLHDVGTTEMRSRIQNAVDGVDQSAYDAILIGYGLCNNGIVGLTSRATKLVIPRAHDCITLFLGSKERYLEYFQNNPGVYFQTTGWIERGEVNGELSQLAIGQKLKIKQTFEDLVARYGEENAKYLWEQLGRTAAEKAQARSWEYEKIPGDMGMFHRLVNGIWDDHEFLVVPPGCRVAPTYDDGIIAVESKS